MARSLHTQKLELRAERRLARPYSKRRSEAARVFGWSQCAAADTSLSLPISIQRPPPGLTHPLTQRDIRSLIEGFGPLSIYGLRSIRLRSESAILADGIVFGEYALPGGIHLYSLPEGDWNLPFLLLPQDRAAFRRHGAQIEIDVHRGQTSVTWHEQGLKQYLLYDVLAHEFGHHAVQRRCGKFLATTCRKSDHEAQADLYGMRSRRMTEECTSWR
jgi:hypothetical protein